MRNIILCGFMGCGKTTVGKLLAYRMGMEYLDTDIIIETMAGKPIPEIFSEDGERAFREMEHQAVLSLEKRTKCVISTGGGTLIFPQNVAAISQEDAVIFLDAGFAVCYRRIKNSARPLVKQNNRNQLRDLYMYRQEFYISAATTIVDASRQPPTVVDEICKKLPF